MVLSWISGCRAGPGHRQWRDQLGRGDAGDLEALETRGPALNALARLYPDEALAAATADEAGHAAR